MLQTALRCGHNAGAGRRAASHFQVHAAAGKAIRASNPAKQLCLQESSLILRVCSLQHLEKCRWTLTEILASWLTLMLARCVNLSPFITYSRCHSHTTNSCPDQPIFFVCGYRFSCFMMHVACAEAELLLRYLSKLLPLFAALSHMPAVQ